MLSKILFTLCTLLPLVISAQDEYIQRFKAGGVLGVNLSQVDGDMADGFNKLGFVAGLRGVVVLEEKMELSIEMLYSQRGSVLRKASNVRLPFKINLNYVEVPIAFNYQDWADSEGEYYKMHFHAGLAYSRLFSATIEDDSGPGGFETIADFFEKNDFSWLAGVTYFATKNIGITARYTRSINRLFSPDDSTPAAVQMRGYFVTLRVMYMLN